MTICVETSAGEHGTVFTMTMDFDTTVNGTNFIRTTITQEQFNVLKGQFNGSWTNRNSHYPTWHSYK